MRSLSDSHLCYQPGAECPDFVIKVFRAPYANFFLLYIHKGFFFLTCF